MKKTSLFFACCAMLLPFALIAQDAGPTPAQILNITILHVAGRSPAQVIKDQNECYANAKKQTGVDPLNPPPRPEERSPQKGPMATAAPIAVTAATHSPIGLAVSAGRRRRAENQNAQQQMSYDENWQQSMNAVRLAFTTCMEGKSYAIQ